MLLTSNVTLKVMQSQKETLDYQIRLRQLSHALLCVFLPFVMINPILRFDMIFIPEKHQVTGKNVYKVLIEGMMIDLLLSKSMFKNLSESAVKLRPSGRRYQA